LPAQISPAGQAPPASGPQLSRPPHPSLTLPQPSAAGHDVSGWQTVIGGALHDWPPLEQL
jgi:hypothetical protein